MKNQQICSAVRNCNTSLSVIDKISRLEKNQYNYGTFEYFQQWDHIYISKTLCQQENIHCVKAHKDVGCD